MKIDTLIAVGVTVMILAVFWQVRGHDFVIFDDGRYITENPHIQNGLTWDNVVWAFSTTYANFWHPLTWLSHMLDWHLFGANPAGHHLTSILLHILYAVLLFTILLKMTGARWESALVAVLFAIHPLHVESVAWASERKDVLSTLFWLLTMASYYLYVQKKNLHCYALFMVCYLLGLMAKPMLVTLPFVLMLLDYWPLNRFKRHCTVAQRITVDQVATGGTGSQNPGIAILLIEKVPLILCALSASVLAYFAQATGGATKPLDLFPWDIRVMNALLSYGLYLFKTVWPANLAVFYPHPGGEISLVQVCGATILLLTVTLFALLRIRTTPFFGVGWFWFLGTLVPVIGIVQVGDHGMADRYTYVPHIGLFIVLSWGIPHVLEKVPRGKRIFAVAGTCCITALAVCSWFQVSHWKDSVTLFKHALAVERSSPLAHTDLGQALAAQGRLDEAVGHYKQALGINPDYLGARVNLGSVLAAQGKLDEAISHYQLALLAKRDLATVHYNLANALARQGKLQEAIDHYEQAVVHQPNDPELHNNLGITLARQGKLQQAMACFRKAAEIEPNFEPAHRNLDLVLKQETTVSTLPEGSDK
jgi:tetratricopeptide (TPR) repeat protein